MSGGLSFLRAAEEVPKRVALVVGGVAYTFADLAPAVRAAAAELGGVGREGRAGEPALAGLTGVVGAPRLESLIAIYALIETGLPFLAIHPRLTPVERQLLLRRAGVRRVLGEDWQPPAGAPARLPSPVVDGARCLAVVATSGTGGGAKLAVLSRLAWLAAARASEANLGWEEEDRWLLAMPVAHVGGLSILTRCLLGRRSVVVSEAPRFEPAGIATQIDRDRVTLVSVVPTMLRRLLSLEPPWSPPRRLRAVLLGGAGASPRLLEAAAERGWPVLTTYGLTEACSQVSTQRYGTVNRGDGGVGMPMAGVEVRIGSEVPGQIELRGPVLFDGYLEDGRIRDPRVEGWFSTGDLGLFDAAGRLHILGRLGDLIISGGENVLPAEVEAALEAHPGVARACVLGLEDEEWGQRVVAALLAATPERPAQDALKRHLAELLAPYKRPRQLLWLDAFPEGPSHKLDRRAIRAAVLARLEAGEAG